MSGEIRTAVLAAASNVTRRQAVHALSSAGIELLGVARDGISALEMLQQLRPDLLAAEAALPMMDGCSLVKRILNSFCLPVRPAAALMGCPDFRLPDDISPAIWLNTPVEEDAFIRAKAALKRSRTAFSAGQEMRALKLLESLGVPEHIGRDCLQMAVLLCASDERLQHNLGRDVYPLLGERFGLSCEGAQRAVRHAIERAWQSNQFENQYRIFADTVDAARGQPTAREMISRLADILRLEG